MPWVLILLIMLTSFGVWAATDQFPRRDYAKTLDEENRQFLKQLSRLVKAKGFSEVEIIPQLFVARVKDTEGHDRTLIINSDTLQAYPFEGQLPLVEERREMQ